MCFTSLTSIANNLRRILQAAYIPPDIRRGSTVPEQRIQYPVTSKTFTNQRSFFRKTRCEKWAYLSLYVHFELTPHGGKKTAKM
jgi:hypothetical protein